MQEITFWAVVFIWWFVAALVVSIIIGGLFDDMGRRG